VRLYSRHGRNTPDPKAFCGWLGNMPRQRRGRQDVKRARYLEMSAFEALLSYREAPTGTLCHFKTHAPQQCEREWQTAG
jgi:hypothetical protein